MSEKRILATILILFTLLGILYSFMTPVFEASDELWHYPMVRHLADGNPLPVQVFEPELAGPWKQEASQPPLYYWLGAALTFWIDTANMEATRYENPHVDNGLITEDGNRNLVVHDPSLDPWRGTLLAVRIVRVFSVLLGLATVYLTYQIGRMVAPQRTELALGAAAANAFLPMFLFITGSVNNDNLAIMLASLALFLMIRMVAADTSRVKEKVEAENKINIRQFSPWLLLGAVLGLGLLTKEGTIGLLPMALGTAFVVTWRRNVPLHVSQPGHSTNHAVDRDHANSKRSAPTLGLTAGGLVHIVGITFLLFLVTLIPVLVIAGWWYFRNIQLYGDWLGWSAFIAVLGQRGHPASLAQLWGERHGFLMAYWGLFGGVNIPMPSWIYSVLNSLLLLSVTGFVFFFVKRIWTWLKRSKGQWSSVTAWISNLLNFTIANFALIACLLFSAAVVIGLIRWATTTWSSQGRLVFTALSALSVLFITGLVGPFPRRIGRWIAGLIGAFLFSIAALAPFLWITPPYQPDSYVPPRPFVMHGTQTTFGQNMRLRGAAIESPNPGQSTLHPGDDLWVHLEWEVLNNMDDDWSVFVHLIDPVLERPIAQRDMYLGQGLLLTSWLIPGERLVNSYKLHIPSTTIAPAQLDVAVGLYNFDNGERLDTGSGNEFAIVGKVQLEPLDGTTPNPLVVNFEDKLQLSGFDIQPRRAAPGEAINLELHWQPLRELDTDYTFFVQIVGDDTTRWASYDFKPSEGTSSWQPDNVTPMPITLTVDENAPPGLYPLIVGIYTQNAEGNFDRLQILTPDGRLTDDFLELTKVRIDQK